MDGCMFRSISQKIKPIEYCHYDRAKIREHCVIELAILLLGGYGDSALNWEDVKTRAASLLAPTDCLGMPPQSNGLFVFCS